MTDEMKLANLKNRLKCLNTRKELHDLTYFSPFVDYISMGSTIIFKDGTEMACNIEED